MRVDATRATRMSIRALAATVLDQCLWAFSGSSRLRLARACIARLPLRRPRGRTRVRHRHRQLDGEARAAGVSVISGASSVPGYRPPPCRAHGRALEQLTEVHIGISPGNSFDPGVATTASIIGRQAGPAHASGRSGRHPLRMAGAAPPSLPGDRKRWMGPSMCRTSSFCRSTIRSSRRCASPPASRSGCSTSACGRHRG